MTETKSDILMEQSGRTTIITAASTQGREWLNAHVMVSGLGETVYCNEYFADRILTSAIEHGLRIGGKS
jgi:hypothetical protein